MTELDRARVAVVVPAHQAGTYLAETLASVRAQTFPHWICVVVDDGSTDDTAAVTQSFVDVDPRFRLVRQANAGVSAARNAGLAALPDGPGFLAFLDSDDTWTPDALAGLVAAAEDRPDAVGVYGLAEYMDAAGRPVRQGAHPAAQADRRRMGRVGLVEVPPRADSTFETLVVSGTIWPPGVGLFRRDAVDRAGRFDAEQRYVEDWDLFLRMSRFGPFVPVARHVAWYRQHAENLTKHTVTMAQHHVRVRWKAWSSPANTTAQRREALRVWRRLQLRWVWWTAQAVGAAVRARRVGDARDAARALALFTVQLAAGRPTEPDVRTARAVARYVEPRTAGRGRDGH